MGKLTQRAIMSLVRTPGRYGDGDGLYFRVLDANRVYWTYRYRNKGKEREMSLGPYPEITLAEARAKHAGLRASVVRDKVDPLASKRNARVETIANAKPTFGRIADGYIATHESGWRNAKHREQWRMTLTRYCSPIREMPVDAVDTAAVLTVLTPIWDRAPETASRLRGRIEAILDAARVLGHVDGNRANPARWKGHLQKVLPKPRKLTRGHHAAMHYRDVPAFVARLRENPTAANKALEYAILTASRSGEVRGATWDEVDFKTATWTISSSRMKTEREHRVPLSDRAVEILRELKASQGENLHVFPGARPRQLLSEMAFAMAMRRLGAGAFTPHGFRSAFRDWCSERAKAPFELAEKSLAHNVGNDVSRAYARSDLLDLRRSLMAQWALYCDGGTRVAQILPIQRGR
jgi:integrase